MRLRSVSYVTDLSNVYHLRKRGQISVAELWVDIAQIHGVTYIPAGEGGLRYIGNREPS